MRTGIDLKFLNSLLTFVLVAMVSACIPKRNSSAGIDSSRSSSNTLSVTSVKTGSSQKIPKTDPLGNYYSSDPVYTFTGVCRGSIKKVRIEITPLAQAPTSEVVNCTNESFSWNKTFSSENSYAVKLSALDETATVLGAIPVVNKVLVYDITQPTAPTFVTPTTGSSYVVNDGRAQITITGQVLNEVAILLGSSQQVIPLTPNPDHIHQDFTYTLALITGNTVTATFTAFDYAENSNTNSMAVQSQLTLSIPVAANELGGSFVNNGLLIQSTVGVLSGPSISGSTQMTLGSSSIAGELK